MRLGITIHYGASRFDLRHHFVSPPDIASLRGCSRADLTKVGRTISSALGLKDPETKPFKGRRPNPHRRRRAKQETRRND